MMSDRFVCLQQENNTPQQILDKTKLIQAATNRLRQKKLEREYEAFKSHLVELQSQLEVIRLDTTISLNLLPTDFDENQQSFFEKRLCKHKAQLEQLLANTRTSGRKMISSSLSSFSSISSLLSTEKSNEESDYYSLLGESIISHQKRRKRRQQAKEPLSSSSSSSSDIGKREVLVLHSTKNTKKDGLIKRNALDETLSFLNELKSDTDDGGFRQDIYNMISDMITKQVKNKTIDQGKYYYSAEYPAITITQDDKHIPINEKPQNLFKKCISIGWKWFRFIIIMTLAIIINLKKGPKSFLYNQHLYNNFTY